MKFLTLQITNFLTVGSGQIALNDRGLNVVQGINEDDTSASSNGSGKSSIVDALCWCLYGVTARGAKGDAVINRTAGKGTFVQLVMLNGATTYTVTRFRKHKDHKNQLQIEAMSSVGADTSLSVRLDKGTEAESQKVLESILGCSYEVFIAAVYAGQEIMPDLPRMTDRELKSLIEEGAGLQRIERAYQLARERMNTLKTTLGAEGVRMSTLDSQYTRTESMLAEATGATAEWEEGRAGRLESANLLVKVRTEEVHDAKNKCVALDVHLPKIDARLKELSLALADHSRLTAIASGAQAVYLADERKINRAGLTAAATLIKNIEAKIAAAPEHMKESCKECGKPHTIEDLDKYLTLQKWQLADAREAATKLSVEVKAQIERSQKSSAEAETCKLAIPDVSAVTAEIGKLTLFKTGHREAAVTLARLVKDAEAAAVALARVVGETNPHASSVERVKTQLAAIEASRVEVSLTVAELAEKITVAEMTVKLFGPAGVRAQILDTVTPYLNSRTADYLSVLSDGNLSATWTTLTKAASGDLKEKFSIDVSNLTGGESFTGLSGGEKRKVRLATALALQDLVASRAANPIDLWIGDEVDDALDTSGLERLMTILDRKARERGTVLMISHHSLSDWCDSVTTVRKKDGRSTIEGALAE